MSDLVKDLAASLKAVLAHAENMTCELDDTDDLSGYPYIQRARRVLARAAKRPRKPPYVLVTVSGGVAEVFHRDEGCEIDVFDFDNWNAGRDLRDLRRAKAIAKNLPPGVGAAFLEELE